MPERYAAFISYAHRYRDWVAILQRNLERSLTHHRVQPHEVWLDTVDLATGYSWVGGVNRGLARSENLILVVTPEALTSPEVTAEWQGFYADRGDRFQGHWHLVRLVETALPPLLGPVHYVDFEGHNEKRYRQGLKELAGALMGHRDQRDLPKLPRDIEVPAPPLRRLPTPLRRRLEKALAPLLDDPLIRSGLFWKLKPEPQVADALEELQPPELAASALLVALTGGDDPALTLELVDQILAFLQPKPALQEHHATLATLRDELASLPGAGEEPGLFDGYLAQVAGDHRNLVPIMEEETGLDLLSRVYVEVELQPQLDSLEEGPDPLPRGGGRLAEEKLTLPGPLEIRQLLALQPDEHPWVTRRWVLKGEPGTGKTTLLRHLAAELAADPGRPWIPVYEPLPELVRQGTFLLERLEERLRQVGQPADGLARRLDGLGRQGGLLLLIDGLDEVGDGDLPAAERLLRSLSEKWKRSPMVVTTRPFPYRPFDSRFREGVLLPLDRPRQLELLARWFGRRRPKPDHPRAERELARFEGDRDLRELAGNPLYLTLLAMLREADIEPERNRSLLYGQILTLLLEGKHRRPPRPLEPTKPARRLLTHVAYGMTRQNRDGEPLEDLEVRLLDPEARKAYGTLPPDHPWRKSPRTFFQEAEARTALLGCRGPRSEEWRFLHRGFREALTAERLKAIYEHGGESAVLQHASQVAGDESRWAEPYALLAGQIGEPDALVKALVKENRALGLRALATAQNLKEETLAEVLELTAEWKERAKVYPRVPELVGEAERALLLLGRLGEGVRNGNDLYFLDVAIQRAAQRWREWASRAEEVRRGLYERIPAPDPDLFEWVETPRDGRVPLWREIPEGGFWVGSPKGEGLDWEHPRHRVRFREGFEIATVPVTNAQYAAFDPAHKPRHFRGVSEEELAHHPVVNVTWFEAASFCRWLVTVDERFRGARLPTEEEWEHACRAGSLKLYWSGDGEEELARVGWYDANSEDRSHRVGEKPANPWGLYDVHGNVWEWTVTTWEREAYAKRAEGIEVDPSQVAWEEEAPTEPSGGDRVIRGGSAWNVAVWARAGFRSRRLPGFRLEGLGFRVVLPGAPSR